MRVAIGGLMHESNTFAGSKTDRAAFESGGLETGDGIARRWGDAHHEVGGFLEGARRFAFEPVPTLMGWATPAGPLTADTYSELIERLLDQLKAAGPVDAVLLALHGAMVVDGLDDADGFTLTRVRELIGPRRPLVVTLDYHANVSQRMVDASDAIVAYQTYPHIDQRERGIKAAAIASAAAAGAIRSVQALEKPPILIHLLAQETARGPMSKVIDAAQGFTSEPGLLDLSILAGFPYADVAACGPSCIAVTDGDPDQARRIVRSLAEIVMEQRHALTAAPSSPELAVRSALALETRTPALLIDLGDNVGGGSAADGTVLFHELLRQGATDSLVVLFDPDAVSTCAAAGVGNEVQCEAGGKIDRHAAPLRIHGRVRTLHDGRYTEEQPRHGGIRFQDQGRTAVVELERGNLVVLNSQRHPPFSLGQLTSLGIQPESLRSIVVKAAVAYKAAYAPIAGTIIEVDTPGLTAANPARFTYHRIKRPILPLDPDPLVERHWNERRSP